jgi:hypothetical protein
VIPSKLPLLILGGIDVNLSGQLDNLPPLISFMSVTSGSGVKHVSILVYLKEGEKNVKKRCIKK